MTSNLVAEQLTAWGVTRISRFLGDGRPSTVERAHGFGHIVAEANRQLFCLFRP